MTNGTTTLECTSTPQHHALRSESAALFLRQLLSVFKPRSVADPTEGSGTVGVICMERGINYYGLDLATGFDLVRVPLAAVLPTLVDLVFLHPPYYRVLPYSGVVWGALPDCRDLSHLRDWDRYLARLLRMIRNASTGVAPGGFLVLLLGDVRVGGHIYRPGQALASELGQHRTVELPRHHFDRRAIHPVVREHGVIIDVTLAKASLRPFAYAEAAHG